MKTIPKLSDLYASIITDLETQLGYPIPTFGKNFIRALAQVQAAKLKLVYLSIANTQKNIFIDTAEPESAGGTLERFGLVKLNRLPYAAKQGQYRITVTGVNGAVILANTIWKSDDDSANPGMLFILDATFNLTSSSGVVTVRALEAGQGSQLSISDTLSLTSPIANVDKTATVLSELVEPLAAESIEDYRQAGLNAYRLEPNGGSGSDYRLWAADAQGVSKVYPYAKSGAANEINIYVEATIADSTDGKGTPSASILADVEDWVEANQNDTNPYTRGRRPLGVFDIHYLPVSIKEIDINIASSIGLTTDIRNQIFDAMKASLALKRPFIASSDILSEKNDTIDINGIIAVILATRPGSLFGTVTLEVDGVPLSTYTLIEGNIPYLNAITYV